MAQRKQLVKRNRTTMGTVPFLADVNAVQVQGLVDIPTAVLTNIAPLPHAGGVGRVFGVAPALSAH